MLHDTGNQHVLAVGNHVNLNFNARHILIDQYGVVNAGGKNFIHVPSDFLVVMDNHHVLTADNVGRTKQHGISQLVCRL